MSKIIHGNCISVMKDIGDKSIDMILCDPPYGKTAEVWDTIIPFHLLWIEYKRIIKDNGAIVLFSIQPFTSKLIMSNIYWYRHEWIWVKNTQTGMMLAGKAPMKKHENIIVFSRKRTMFNGQKLLGSEISQHHSKRGYTYKNKRSSLYNVEGGVEFSWSEFIHPNTILLCNVVGNRDKTKKHPTQKPVPLLEYFIKTYTNPGDLVLDNCAGSGSTGEACKNTDRDYILIEQDLDYFNIIQQRLI